MDAGNGESGKQVSCPKCLLNMGQEDDENMAQQFEKQLTSLINNAEGPCGFSSVAEKFLSQIFTKFVTRDNEKRHCKY
jgi:hypothetical protein